MTHKLIVTSLLALLPSDGQLPVGMVIVLIYLILLLYLHPYIREDDDSLHLLCQVELLLLLCVGYVFYTLPANQSYTTFDDTVISIALFFACVAFLGLFLHHAVKSLYEVIRSALARRRKQKALEAKQAAKAAAAASNPPADKPIRSQSEGDDEVSNDVSLHQNPSAGNAAGGEDAPHKEDEDKDAAPGDDNAEASVSASQSRPATAAPGDAPAAGGSPSPPAPKSSAGTPSSGAAPA
jgi:hypothetical protein